MSYYADLYNKLYAHGYHAWQDSSHGVPLLQWLMWNAQFQTALDIGSSNGASVRYVENRGKNAVGVDIATKAREDGLKRGTDIRIASATHIPFAENSFDVVMSFDCFEHLRPEDVETAIQEAIRISRRYLAFRMPSGPDRDPRWRKIAGEPLHLTMQPIQWWINKFKGFAPLPTQVVYRTQNEFVMDMGTPNVLLVGNGPSMAGFGIGETIDHTFDIVYRMNNFAIKGYERDVGTKTDVWVHSPHTDIRARDHQDFGEVLFASVNPTKSQHRWERCRDKSRKSSECAADWVHSSQVTGESVSRVMWKGGFARTPGWCSTGLITMDHLIQLYGKINICGFDHFDPKVSRQQHYFKPGAKLNPGPHNTELERTYVKGLADSGQVHII